MIITLKWRVLEAQGEDVAHGDCAEVSPGTRLNRVLRGDQPVGNKSTLSLEQLPG